MAGGGTSTSTSSSGSTDPQVTSTLNQLLQGVSNAYSAGPTYTGPGSLTQAGQNNALSASNNPAFSQGLGSAFNDANGLLYGNGLSDIQNGARIAGNNIWDQYGALGANQGLNGNLQGSLNSYNDLAGQYGAMANDPGSTQAGRNLINSVTTGTNASFNNSGLFGSDNNQTATALGLTQGLGNLQQGYLQGQQSALGGAAGIGQTGSANQFNATGGQSGAAQNSFAQGQQGVANQTGLSQLLSQLYQTSQLPAGTQTAIGAQQDEATQNAANKNINLLGQLSQILYGSAPTAGTTTTNTTPTPSTLQSLAGLATTLL